MRKWRESGCPRKSSRTCDPGFHVDVLALVLRRNQTDCRQQQFGAESEVDDVVDMESVLATMAGRASELLTRQARLVLAMRERLEDDILWQAVSYDNLATLDCVSLNAGSLEFQTRAMGAAAGRVPATKPALRPSSRFHGLAVGAATSSVHSIPITDIGGMHSMHSMKHTLRTLHALRIHCKRPVHK